MKSKVARGGPSTPVAPHNNSAPPPAKRSRMFSNLPASVPTDSDGNVEHEVDEYLRQPTFDTNTYPLANWQ
ncbi:hypothetical protein LSAT2_000533, partial [Lamellibrachia satsuma]